MTKLRKLADKEAPRYDRMPAGVPSLIDLHVGRRLRQRRSLLGMSQEYLGESVGVTFQQIQKYERGSNRIGASRLYQFSIILDISVAYFFEDMPKVEVASFENLTAHYCQKIGARYYFVDFEMLLILIMKKPFPN